MKHFMLNNFFILCLIILIPQTSYAVPPYISFRSQGVSNARHLVGVSQDVNKPNMTSPYGLLSATFEYGKIFEYQADILPLADPEYAQAQNDNFFQYSLSPRNDIYVSTKEMLRLSTIAVKLHKAEQENKK